MERDEKHVHQGYSGAADRLDVTPCRMALVSLISAIFLHAAVAKYVPSIWILSLFALSLIGVLYLPCKRLCFYLGVFTSALLLANYEVGEQLNSQLPHALERQDVVITGQIISMPDVSALSVQFDFLLTSVQYKNQKFPQIKRIRLRDYNKQNHYRYGQHWQFNARLKRPRGYVNPGNQFDYEKYLFYQRIDATGYAKKGVLLKKPKITAQGMVMQLRRNWQKFVSELSEQSPHGTLINALTVGLRGDMSHRQWQVLQQTGTAHLFAISGLHVGFVAFLAVGISGFILRYCRKPIAGRPVQDITWLYALWAAFFYAWLAGFSLPTVRALVALFVIAVFYFLRVRLHVIDYVLLTVAMLFLLDPLTPLSVSFWLSCGAVIILIFVATVLLKQQSSSGIKNKCIYWVKMQFALCFFMQPLTYLIFSKVVLIAPLANMLAIPLVAFILVPVGLLAVLLFMLSEILNIEILLTASRLLIKAALIVMDYLWQFLEGLSDLPMAAINLPDFSWIMVFFIVSALLLIILPIKKTSVILLLIMILLLIWRPTPLPSKAFTVTMLDIGQGLAVVIQTRNHYVLFDTGAAYASGFNMGQAVITPYLNSLGAKQLHTVLISHRHNDHSGGWHYIKQHFPVRQKLTGAIEYFPEFVACQRGQHWSIDGVRFDVLWPAVTDNTGGNNSSCVVRISSEYGSMLLSADIEKSAEMLMLASIRDGLRTDVLQVAHQGSKTSSSHAFIDAAAPMYALVSSGYLNRFSHPHEIVVKRFVQKGVKVMNTAYDGAIVVTFDRKGVSISAERTKRMPYWRQK